MWDARKSEGVKLFYTFSKIDVCSLLVLMYASHESERLEFAQYQNLSRNRIHLTPDMMLQCKCLSSVKNDRFSI